MTAEYIERNAAIDACFNGWNNNAHDCAENIRLIPAADVRPVVYCKDCKYFSEVMYKGTQFEYGYCDRWADGTRMDSEDFCSRAVKREKS